MVYPTIMVIVGTIVVALLITLVVPKIATMMTRKGKTLPLPTQVLIGTSDFLVKYWLFVALGLIGLSLAFNWLVRTQKGRLAWDSFKLRLPVFGDLLVKQSVGRFASTFSTLLRSGVPAIQAIQVTKATLNNKVLTNALQQVHDHIVEGADIATPLRLSGVFPPVVSYMVAVGEQAGNLEDVLEQISANYDEEIEIATQKLTAVIEPMIVVVLAVIVAGIIISIVQPLLELQKMTS
jgi:type II secretory pathway component PulF